MILSLYIDVEYGHKDSVSREECLSDHAADDVMICVSLKQVITFVRNVFLKLC
jgi:hypothetical protein